MVSEFIPPRPGKRAFTCPHCGEYAQQSWSPVTYIRNERPIRSERLFMSICYRCRKYMIWRGQTILYPEFAYAPPPDPDLGEAVRELYMEAALIVRNSPRAAAALLRMCLRQLCQELEAAGETLGQQIVSLLRKGMESNPQLLQECMDLMVPLFHDSTPCETIHSEDDPLTAFKLFDVINLLVQEDSRLPVELERLCKKLRAEDR